MELVCAPPALPVRRQHDGQDTNGGCRIVWCLGTVAKVDIGLVEVLFPEHGLPPDLADPEVVASVGIIFRLKGVELTCWYYQVNCDRYVTHPKDIVAEIGYGL